MIKKAKTQAIQAHLIKGYSLVELLVALGLLGVMIPVLFAGFIATRDGKPQQEHRLQASTLLQEAVEAVRAVREQGWTEFALDGVFHPEIDQESNVWTLVPEPEMIKNRYQRQITIESIERDEQGAVVESGGVLDPSTKKVTVSVDWQESLLGNLSSTFYVTRYLDNLVYVDTTREDFLKNGSSSNNVEVVSYGDGALQLAPFAPGRGNWCKPTEYIVSEIDLPGSGRVRNVSSIEGKAFTGTRDDGGNYVEVGISNDNPPQLNLDTTVTGYSTNDVFVDDSYAYLATNNVDKDVVIIDLATKKEVGYFDFGGSYWWTVAQGIYVKDNVGYVTVGHRLVTFDLSSKTGSRPELGNVSIGTGLLWFLATGYRLQVVGDYAYIAVNWSSAELRLVNVSNPRKPTLGAKTNVSRGSGREVAVNEDGTRAYLATTASSKDPELFVINTDVSSTNKNNSSYTLQVISSYDAGEMNPQGLSVVPGNRIILVGIGGEEYQVINSANENSLVRCGGFSTGTGIYGISTIVESDDDAYSYIVTADKHAEFKVIEGGPGVDEPLAGWYESAPFDVQYPTAFNRFFTEEVTPNNTSVSYQFAVANSNNKGCADIQYSFIGPDGTDQTRFTQPGAIPFNSLLPSYRNPGNCMKYKVFFETTNRDLTPILESMTINYSP